MAFAIEAEQFSIVKASSDQSPSGSPSGSPLPQRALPCELETIRRGLLLRTTNALVAVAIVLMATTRMPSETTGVNSGIGR